MEPKNVLDRRSAHATPLGCLFQQKREDAGLSQRQLADELRVSRTYVSRLERGEYSNPSPQVLMRFAKRFDVDLSDLYAITGCMLPTDLPAYEAYLHAKHPEWPGAAIDDLVSYYEFVKQRHSLS